MKWINSLNNSKVPYYIYKLNKNDSIIISYEYKNHNQLLIVLHGSVYILKNFGKKQVIPIVILNKNSIFSISYLNNQFYYQFIALEKTYILIIKNYNIKQLDGQLMLNIIQSYQKTLSAYEIMNEAINQKYTKNKVIQIILLIFFQFGIINKKQIQLPFKISQKDLAIMTGTNKATLNKIIKEVSSIEYTKKKSMQINNIFNFTQQ
uniref:Global nitrogen transcriptional regulator n=1 Tax=Osmundea sinicola TaxID=290685 RepID=A0A7L4WNX3_9FLOR|nr:global nitrogen transcriptional regulator [Osmundea sinicola]QFR99973.1 global nitrogen transcriptional regulator [Osmundea sinicola]